MAEWIRPVLVADLIASRKIRERSEVAARIEAALKELNRRFRDELEAPLVTTRGMDELSGVLRGCRHAFDLVVHLNLVVWPHRFRFSLAKGLIDIGARSGDAASMDGPAFHRAARGLSRAREQGLILAVELEERSRAECGLAEAAALLHGTIMRRWTASQQRVVRIFRSVKTQVQAARQLGVSQQAVSQALRLACHSELLHAEEALRQWLAGVEGESG